MQQSTLGSICLHCLSFSLDFPEDFFSDKITKPAAIMCLLYYPPQTGVIDDRTIGIGARTCFTILWQQDEICALQVLNVAGKWVNAVPIPNVLVVNLGDQFACWTNMYVLIMFQHIFKSTMHRAVNCTGVAHYSIPLFFRMDYNVLLE
ncbi:hypothetical protein EI94DRAFT_1890223, partial [Lactarius quietus]